MELEILLKFELNIQSLGLILQNSLDTILGLGLRGGQNQFWGLKLLEHLQTAS